MRWSSLLSAERYYPPPGPPTGSSGSGQPLYHEDAERILYSSAFRRLQGKTQVHPFPVYDYLRTRLTHTIEVAYVGRTIAASIARELPKDQGETFDAQYLGDIVYAACLAHDVGNPPFGHSGEHAIQSWFERRGKTDPIVKEILSDRNKCNDFLCFDGNAQGFRTITRISPFRGEGGLRLTYAVLGAYSKYPYPSEYAPDANRKFGFFSEDSRAAISIYSALGLNKEKTDKQTDKYCRHPLAFVVEAADDICYLTTDLEDATRAGIIRFSDAERLLKGIADGGGQSPNYQQLRTKDEQDRLAYLRSGAIHTLMHEAVRQFYDQYDEIMTGQFHGSLFLGSKFDDQINEISSVCRSQLYVDRRKMEVEQAGSHAISGLLDLYGEMVIQLIEKGAPDKIDRPKRGLYDLLPSEYRRELNPRSPYSSFLVLVDYISGMTDRFALSLFQRLTGRRAVGNES